MIEFIIKETIYGEEGIHGENYRTEVTKISGIEDGIKMDITIRGWKRPLFEINHAKNIITNTIEEELFERKIRAINRRDNLVDMEQQRRIRELRKKFTIPPHATEF